jgi:hypothetical protein
MSKRPSDALAILLDPKVPDGIKAGLREGMREEGIVKNSIVQPEVRPLLRGFYRPGEVA